MIRKLLIANWYGPLPPWYDLWRRNIGRLSEFGFDVLLDTDPVAFRRRAALLLDVDCPDLAADGRKVCDYRCAFGALYEPEIIAGGYDFWGHTDLDCVYGRVEEYVTDDFLRSLDIHSNHVDYMSGPWSLYRSTPIVNHLFLRHADWQGHLENPRTTGWVEAAFTRVVDEAHGAGELVRRYSMWQTHNLNSFDSVRLDGDRLLEGEREIMMAHFRRANPKEYPAGCL